MVADLDPGLGSSDPRRLTVVGRTLFFVGDAEGEPRLWRSDGTAGGTSLVSPVTLADPACYCSPLTNANGTVYFVAFDPHHGGELWQTDGTGAGTRMVHDVKPGPEGSLPLDLTATTTHLYFVADDGHSGRELWAVDLDVVFKNGFE